MTSDIIVLTVVISAFAVNAGTIDAIVTMLAQRMDRLEGRMERVESEVGGLKAAVAGLEHRVS